MRTKLTILLLLVTSAIFAQVQPMGYTDYSVRSRMNIGNGTLVATNASASLELKGTDRGFLPNRLTTVQRDAIVSPATGLFIFNLTTGQYNSYTGSSWEAIGGTGNFIQNQYAGRQAASAYIDTLQALTLRVNSKIAGAMPNINHWYIPYTEQVTRANGGIHISNHPEGSSKDPFNAWETAGVQSNEYGGTYLRMVRMLNEADGDTANSIDYSQLLQSYSRYTFSPTIRTYDSTTGKIFYPKTPGITSTVQLYTQGNNIRLGVSQFGHTGVAFTGTLALFDSIGTINTIGSSTSRDAPMTPFLSDIDMNRAATGGEKKVFRGEVGIAGYFSSWKFHQSATGATTGIGNYWNKVAGFQAGGSTSIGLDKTTLGWAVNKAAILTYSTVDTSIGFWSMEQYNDSNEVKNGYGFVQSGVKDINAFLGKTYIGSWPLKADSDTTTAKLVVKAKMWADSLAVGVISGNAYITGALSVGTNSTTYKAQIVNSAALGLKVTTTTPSTSNPGFAIRDNNTAQEAFFTPSGSNHLAIGNYTNHPIQFYQNNSSIATLNSTSLKVNSGRLNLTAVAPPSSSADASGSTGDLIVGTDGHMYYKTSTGWVKFAGVTF